jgi:predicted RNase H-like HicB family nuclease
MKIKAVVHEAEEGGFWAEVPAIPGCATQGETYEELLKNLQEAIEGCLSVEVEDAKKTAKDRIIEIAV